MTQIIISWSENQNWTTNERYEYKHWQQKKLITKEINTAKEKWSKLKRRNRNLNIERQRKLHIWERKLYMEKLNQQNVSTIFKARSRMLMVKANYIRQNTRTTCETEVETQSHVLQFCDKLHYTNDTRINYEQNRKP